MRHKRTYDIESERVVPAFCAGILVAASLAIVVAWTLSRSLFCGGAP